MRRSKTMRTPYRAMHRLRLYHFSVFYQKLYPAYPAAVVSDKKTHFRGQEDEDTVLDPLETVPNLDIAA